MFNNAIVDFLLRYIPRSKWNAFSSLCSQFSRPLIGSPISFSHNGLSLVEFPADKLPESLYNNFLSFCYPSTIVNREEQIENDRKYYWKYTSTFLVQNPQQDILGCVQIVFRNDTLLLPVEYADTTDTNGHREPLAITPFIGKNSGPITEIYRCRRSFDLTKAQTFAVLMMLFKAVWIKIRQTNSIYSLISFDPDHPELRNLYIRKFDFTDPHISLTYGQNRKMWSLLVKDWEDHKKHYVSKGKFQFYMQTWSNMQVRKNIATPVCGSPETPFAQTNNILFTQNVETHKNHPSVKTIRRRNIRERALRKGVRSIPEEGQTR